MVGAVHTVLLLLILHVEACVCNVLTLPFKVLADAGIICEHLVLVASYALNVSIPSIIVHLSLIFLPLLQVHLVPVHRCTVIVTAILDLVCKLRMLLSDPDLFL